MCFTVPTVDDCSGGSSTGTTSFVTLVGLLLVNVPTESDETGDSDELDGGGSVRRPTDAFPSRPQS